MTRVLAVFLLLLACNAAAEAQPHASPDRVKILRDITVESDETANNIQCFLCSVHVRGRVTGDVVTFGGAVFVNGIVNGDAIAVGGRVEMSSGGKIVGDAVAFGGYVNREDNSEVQGHARSMPYALIPGQYRPTFLGSLALGVINMVFVALGYLVVGDKRAETASLAIERRPASVLFTGFFSLAIFYGLDWLVRYLGRAETLAEVCLLMLIAAVAATGATGLGDWVARLAFPQTKGIWACIGGILALSLLELIPLLGLAVFAIGLIVSLGAAVVTRFGSREVSEPAHALNES